MGRIQLREGASLWHDGAPSPWKTSLFTFEVMQEPRFCRRAHVAGDLDREFAFGDANCVSAQSGTSKSIPVPVATRGSGLCRVRRPAPEPVLANAGDRGTARRGGWRLRTGGADGADNAFAAAAPPERREVIVPWSGYNGWQGSACRVLTPAEIGALRPLAEPHHAAWERCAAKVRDLHARNVAVVLGTDLRQPAHAVVCWTRDGRDYGGTGMAIRLAQHHRIPVLNLAEMDMRAAIDRLDRIAQTLDRRDAKQNALPDRAPKATRQRSMHL